MTLTNVMGSEYFDGEYCFGPLDQGVGPIDNRGSDNFIKGVSSQFFGVMDFGPIDDMGSVYYKSVVSEMDFLLRKETRFWIFRGKHDNKTVLIVLQTHIKTE